MASRRILPMALVILWAFGCDGSHSSPIGESPVLVVAGEPECEACRIELDEIVVLGGPTDSASFRADDADLRCVVGELASGGFIASALVGGQTLFVYDSTGRAVRSIGRGGQGPGEFGRNLSVIVGAADTLFVLDHDRVRMVRMDIEGSYLDSFRLPPLTVAISRLVSGDFLLHTVAVGNDPESPLVRVFDPSGNEIASHDHPVPDLVEVGLADIDGRIVAPTASGGYWTGLLWTYEMHRWASPAERDLTVVREADWFEPIAPQSPDELAQWSVTKPPPHRLLHLNESSDGLLWAYTVVPDRRWEAGQPDEWGVNWARQAMDTMVEVIDLQAGTVLAQHRVDDILMPVCGSDLMSVITETEIGDTRMMLLRPRLTR